MVQVIERGEGYYESRDVETSRVYEWRPERVTLGPWPSAFSTAIRVLSASTPGASRTSMRSTLPVRPNAFSAV